MPELQDEQIQVPTNSCCEFLFEDAEISFLERKNRNDNIRNAVESGNTDKKLPIDEEFYGTIISPPEMLHEHGDEKLLSLDEIFGKAVSEEEKSRFEDFASNLALSGRINELIDAAFHLSKQPPNFAPELWSERDKSLKEKPTDFILRVYGHWINDCTMHQGIIRELDEKLYRAYNQHKQQGIVSNDFQKLLPTQSEFVTTKLLNQDSLSEVEKIKLSRTASKRDNRKKNKCNMS